MRPSSRASLWHALSSARPSNSYLAAPSGRVNLDDLVCWSSLEGRGEELRGRSVIVATRDPLNAAIAMIELDGVARRLVLWPADLSFEHIRIVMDCAAADAVLCDEGTFEPGALRGLSFIRSSAAVVPADHHRSEPVETEWVLLTSGTTGVPKLVVHTLATLTGAIEDALPAEPVVWSTFYDIRRYGGLQIFLRAVLARSSLVLASAEEPIADFLARAGAHGVTHISGTPSHWRRALMSASAHLLAPRYVRLSGEVADQAILSQLQSFYPNAKVAHAFASTEAGVAFDINDGFAGFPASLIRHNGEVELKIEGGSLRIRSRRVAKRYLGDDAPAIADADGFVDTRDLVELRVDRYHFIGRRDGVINVGGLKVHPEEVEAVLNRHPEVRMSLVRTKKSPITGALVVADVVLERPEIFANGHASDLVTDMLRFCREALPAHKVPAGINFVPELDFSTNGKLMRRDA